MLSLKWNWDEASFKGGLCWKGMRFLTQGQQYCDFSIVFWLQTDPELIVEEYKDFKYCQYFNHVFPFFILCIPKFLYRSYLYSSLCSFNKRTFGIIYKNYKNINILWCSNSSLESFPRGILAQNDIYIKLFFAALFIIDWKLSKCPLIGDWLKKYSTSIEWNITQP